MKKLNVVLLLFWMGVIFTFSNDSGSASSNKSDCIADTIVSFISRVSHHDYSDSELSKIIDNCVFIVRKSAHFLEYFILGIFIVNVVKDYKSLKINWILLALLFCFLYACTDEIHQLFVPERSGRLTDVLIDTLGSLCGIIIYRFIYLKFNKCNQNSKIEI